METKTETDSSYSYLLCNYFFSERIIGRIKADVKKFMVDREKDDKYFEFINWKKAKNEILVLTMYAYDDILLPKKYNTVFQIDKPGNHVNVDFTITQAVLNGWTGVDQISRGHKHICVIQFDKTIDSMFNLLTDFDPTKTLHNNIELGFCNKDDFEEIKTRLERSNN